MQTPVKKQAFQKDTFFLCLSGLILFFNEKSKAKFQVQGLTLFSSFSDF